MVASKCDEATFVELFETIGPEATAKRIGVNIRTVYDRRERLEGKLGRQLVAPPTTPASAASRTRVGAAHPPWHQMHVVDGVVLVGSDAHYWPGQVSTAHKAFVHFCRKMKPLAVIMNGDVLDGAKISRHAPIGWETRPSLIDEIEECKARLAEIRKAARTSQHFIWTLGNHDARFETRLATVAPEYALVHGVHLKDHFPDWTPCWAAHVNDEVVVKHRYRGGVHAAWNNTLHAGKTIVTGHVHRLCVTPITDYNGRRWGVDTGTMAELYGPQFADYTELNPVNWGSGFAVLTFRGGRLMWPELVHVVGPNRVDFRGEIIEVA